MRVGPINFPGMWLGAGSDWGAGPQHLPRLSVPWGSQVAAQSRGGHSRESFLDFQRPFWPRPVGLEVSTGGLPSKRSGQEGTIASVPPHVPGTTDPGLLLMRWTSISWGPFVGLHGDEGTPSGVSIPALGGVQALGHSSAALEPPCRAGEVWVGHRRCAVLGWGRGVGVASIPAAGNEARK